MKRDGPFLKSYLSELGTVKRLKRGHRCIPIAAAPKCLAKSITLSQDSTVISTCLPKSLSSLTRPLFVLLFLLPISCLGWGPHPAITQAALDALGTNNPIVLLLGPQAQRLTNYCWMADFKRLPFREPDQDLYADDYLLFPQAPPHLDHI